MSGSVIMMMLLLVLVMVVEVLSTVDTYASCTVAVIGAGPGGLYTAWRLATASNVPASKICVFEQESRVGGRVYTLRSAPGVPEINNYNLDLGAHRYNPQGEHMTSSLINHLNVANDVYPRVNCSSPSPPPSFYLRNKYIQDTTTSNTWPYNFLPQERWGPGNPQSSQPLPENLLFAVYPFIFDFLPNLTSTNPAIKWKAVSDVLNLIKITPVATAQGLLAGNLNARVAFGDIYSSEVWQAAIDTQWAGSSWVYQFNLFWAAREVVAQIVGTGYSYRAPVGGFGKLVEKLASEFTGKGGRIFYNHKLIHIERLWTQTILRFENNAIFASNTVLLNLPPHSIKQLDGQLTPYKSPHSPEVLVALNAVFNVHSTYAYVYYEDAWWANKIGRCSGQITATEVVRSVSYGDLQRSANGKVSGWITLYITGEDNAGYYRQPSLDNGEVLTLISTTNQGRALLSLIHSNLMKIHENFFAQSNISSSTIAPPTKGVVANWNTMNFGGVHVTQPSPLDPSQTLKLYQKPVRNSKVFYVNEATSPRNGWTEGSLIMAEKFLSNNFNLQKPTWLNQAWYDFWIKQDV